MTRALAALLGLTLVLSVAAACGGSDGERSVSGVILEVESTSLTTIDSFTLRSDEGDTLVFGVAPDARPDPDEGFVSGHLRSHAVAAEKVRVFYREENGRLLATRIVHDDGG